MTSTIAISSIKSIINNECTSGTNDLYSLKTCKLDQSSTHLSIRLNRHLKLGRCFRFQVRGSTLFEGIVVDLNIQILTGVNEGRSKEGIKKPGICTGLSMLYRKVLTFESETLMLFEFNGDQALKTLVARFYC